MKPLAWWARAGRAKPLWLSRSSACSITQVLACTAGRYCSARTWPAPTNVNCGRYAGGLVSLIPQSPAAALNPALRIGTQLREAWRHIPQPWSTQQDRVGGLFETVGLPAGELFLKRFPGEISVGQAQRVLIMIALLHSPPLLIADEPTSALDVITQREVLDLLARTARQRQMSTLFISHDLPAIAGLCQRLAILHEGEIVECGPVEKVLSAPAHPYTKRLVAAVPKWDQGTRGDKLNSTMLLAGVLPPLTASRSDRSWCR